MEKLRDAKEWMQRCCSAQYVLRSGLPEGDLLDHFGGEKTIDCTLDIANLAVWGNVHSEYAFPVRVLEIYKFFLLDVGPLKR